MKALIFGANGQDGFYLNRLLIKNSIEVIGVSNGSDRWIHGDIGDYFLVEELIKTHKPEYVFHFAAISTTKHSALFDNHNAISTGTLNILECVKKHNPNSKVFLSGSALQFKNKGFPIDEQTPFEASSPYSVTRIQATYAARYFRKAFGLSIYCGYLFNHDSPLRTESHVNKKITATVNRIVKGSDEKLELGNIDVKKEFNFAGDIVEAIWIMVNQNQVFEAVIGCGKAHSIKEWLVYCFNKANKNWRDFVLLKPGYKPEYYVLISNPKLIKSIGWKPKTNFTQLADMMMDE